jgi:hypothetical protein
MEYFWVYVIIGIGLTLLTWRTLMESIDLEIEKLSKEDVLSEKYFWLFSLLTILMQTFLWPLMVFNAIKYIFAAPKK